MPAAIARNPLTPIAAIAYTAALWAGSSIAFYLFLPVLGIELSYNDSPLAIAAFYLAWVGIAAVAFRGEFASHLSGEREFHDDAILSVIFGIAAGLFLWGLTRLPLPHPGPLAHAADVLAATPWYFLPKSIDILYQQLLIAALVLTLGRQFTFRTVVLLYALLFGGAHLLLLIDGEFPPSVLVFTSAAIVSAAFFPYLLLKVRHGFMYCYMIHWAFYAVLILLLRIYG